MRCFQPDYDHDAVARHLRREAMKGFQRGDDPATKRYAEACTCGVNLPEYPNSVSLILTRDLNPDYLMGWHLSISCVTNKEHREYVPEEGFYWVATIFARYAHLAVEQPLADRSPFGVEKDVHHFLIECDWADSDDPVVTLEGLDARTPCRERARA